MARAEKEASWFAGALLVLVTSHMAQNSTYEPRAEFRMHHGYKLKGAAIKCGPTARRESARCVGTRAHSATRAACVAGRTASKRREREEGESRSVRSPAPIMAALRDAVVCGVAGRASAAAAPSSRARANHPWAPVRRRAAAAARHAATAAHRGVVAVVMAWCVVAAAHASAAAAPCIAGANSFMMKRRTSRAHAASRRRLLVGLCEDARS